jgi:ParB family transcriptional regulator, chromosome partitioning protein
VIAATEKNGHATGQLSKTTKAKAKGRGVSVETPTESLPQVPTPQDGFETVQRVVSIPIAKLHRHAKNRIITPESVADLVESLSEHGQREPIKVRPLRDPIGHFEILSGERRFVAAQQVKTPPMESLLAIVETHSDGQSIIELAVANAARQDLNPIERSELLVELIAPIDEGGAGMERVAAGRLFGLNTDGAVKNAIRLLKLPQMLREKVASGVLPIRKVRPLCAYPDAILAKFADWLKKAECWQAKQYFDRDVDDDEQDQAILWFIDHETRPVDAIEKYDHGYQNGGEWNCLFNVDELTQDKRAELQIVEIPFVLPAWERRQSKKSKAETPKTRLVALNTKLWHKLQDPLLKVALEKKKAAAASKGKPKKVSGDSEATPAELKAQAKARRKKADEQLRTFTDDWVCRVLRCTMSDWSPKGSWCKDHDEVHAMLPWLIESVSRDQISLFNEWAVCELKDINTSKWQGRPAEFKAFLQEVGHSKFYLALWRMILWPSPTTNHSHCDLPAPGTIPDYLPIIAPHDVHDLAAACGVSMELVWKHATKESFERSMVLQWFLRHTKEQLVDLASSLGVGLKDGKRADMAAELLSHHQLSPQKKPLKLPAAFASKKGAK